jgi:hypothetical protein
MRVAIVVLLILAAGPKLGGDQGQQGFGCVWSVEEAIGSRFSECPERRGASTPVCGARTKCECP